MSEGRHCEAFGDMPYSWAVKAEKTQTALCRQKAQKRSLGWGGAKPGATSLMASEAVDWTTVHGT